MVSWPFKSTTWMPSTSREAIASDIALARRSLLVNFRAGSQIVSGLVPVLVRRSLRTASGLPEGMSQDFDIRMPKDGDAVFVHSVPVRQPAMLVSLLGI